MYGAAQIHHIELPGLVFAERRYAEPAVERDARRPILKDEELAAAEVTVDIGAHGQAGLLAAIHIASGDRTASCRVVVLSDGQDEASRTAKPRVIAGAA